MAVDRELAARVRAHLPEGVVERRMFGGLAFLLRGNLACGILGSDLIVRVGRDRYQEASEEPHVRPFDFTRRPMRGWVMVGPAGTATDAALAGWVAWGAGVARALPPK